MNLLVPCQSIHRLSLSRRACAPQILIPTLHSFPSITTYINLLPSSSGNFTIRENTVSHLSKRTAWYTNLHSKIHSISSPCLYMVGNLFVIASQPIKPCHRYIWCEPDHLVPGDFGCSSSDFTPGTSKRKIS